MTRPIFAVCTLAVVATFAVVAHRLDSQTARLAATVADLARRPVVLPAPGTVDAVCRARTEYLRDVVEIMAREVRWTTDRAALPTAMGWRDVNANLGEEPSWRELTRSKER